MCLERVLRSVKYVTHIICNMIYQIHGKEMSPLSLSVLSYSVNAQWKRECWE